MKFGTQSTRRSLVNHSQLFKFKTPDSDIATDIQKKEHLPVPITNGFTKDLTRVTLDSVLGESVNLHWYTTTDFSRVGPMPAGSTGLAVATPMNDYGGINHFLRAANRILTKGSQILVCVYPMHQRERERFGELPGALRNAVSFTDFLIHRVIPRRKHLRKLYFSLTKGKGRVLSLSESMARLHYNGFEVRETFQIGRLVWILANKTGSPSSEMPDNRMLLRLKRIGYQGKEIRVYKFRTMHPYSAHLQHFVYSKNSLNGDGKFHNDFRTTSWGTLFRKYWLDEFPMFINFFKGELKLVGVRPLSEQFFNLYPKDLQALRTQTKPGLVPPYYADMPKGLKEIQESERRYLESYIKTPWRTDFTYFFKVFYNIFFRRARSG